MDVRLSPEQQALRDSAVQLVAHLGPRTVRDLDNAERRAKLDASVAAAGWRELRTAKESGRPWASAVEAAIVAEELSRGLVDAPFLGPTLAAELRRLVGVEATGARETIALTSDLRSLGGDIAIDVAAAGAALGLVGNDLVSFEFGDQPELVDLTRPSSAVHSPATIARISEEQLTRWTALGLALTSTELVGAMRGAVELTTAYAKERQQYGTAIGSFQAIQHLLADAFTLMEGSHSVALHAAWAVDALPAVDAAAAGALAKAYCARAARAVGEMAIQVHGGVGNTWDCLAHVFLRRSILSADVLGGVDANLAAVLAHRSIETADGLR